MASMGMTGGMQPQIVILKEGTDTSQGKAQLISNINACQAVVECVSSTLGPRGMDKLIHSGNSVTVTNDGATVIKLLDIIHPAAKTLVDIAQSQDAEVGDGTTTVTVLAGELLKEAKQFVEDGVHPQVISRAYKAACQYALEQLAQLSVTLDFEDPVAKRDTLVKCATTTLQSKLIGGSHGDFFAQMTTDACLFLEDSNLSLDLIGIKKVPGGGMSDSFLVEGVAFKKTFSYAGFEQQPKKLENAKVLSLNVELELKSESEKAEIRINEVEDYASIVEAEWEIIYTKLEEIHASGATVVLSKLAIGDLATQWFADRQIFCAGRVDDKDLERVHQATGAVMQASTSDLTPEVLGSCGLFEERQVGDERYNIFTQCTGAKSATIVIRGGAEQFIEEAERSLHDAIMIVRRTLKNNTCVPGGGAIDMELSKAVKQHAMTVAGKGQYFMLAFAKALEAIPRTLAKNAGFDCTDLLNKLRYEHNAKNDKNCGIDIENGSVCDTWERFVWEPSLVKRNAIVSATEAACLILSIDETIKVPESSKDNVKPGAPGA
jgi:T-complex protein 1 subunit eta